MCGILYIYSLALSFSEVTLNFIKAIFFSCVNKRNTATSETELKLLRLYGDTLALIISWN